MKTKLNPLQAFKAMTFYLDMYYTITSSDDLGSLLGGFELFEEGGTWDPAVWHDWMDSIKKVRNIQFKDNELEITLSISEALKAMTFFIEKYYELTTYDDLASILSPLILFEKNHDYSSSVWNNWIGCVNKALQE